MSDLSYMRKGSRRYRAGSWRAQVNCAHCLDPESNHTTAQHELAMQPMCRTCHEVPVHEEDERCPECVQEAHEAREQDYYDALAKDEGGQG